MEACLDSLPSASSTIVLDGTTSSDIKDGEEVDVGVVVSTVFISFLGGGSGSSGSEEENNWERRRVSGIFGSTKWRVGIPPQTFATGSYGGGGIGALEDS